MKYIIEITIATRDVVGLGVSLHWCILTLFNCYTINYVIYIPMLTEKRIRKGSMRPVVTSHWSTFFKT